jgi:hypothetical protein
MRDIETIDGELRLLARERRVARHLSGCTPDTALIDRLLDERAGASAGQRNELVDDRDNGRSFGVLEGRTRLWLRS